MPQHNPGLCVGQCAADVAQYIRQNFAQFAKAGEPAPGKEFECKSNLVAEDENLIRRLTKADYNRVILYTTGVDVSAEVATIPDQAFTVRAFNNNAIEITVTAQHVTAFRSIAEKIAPKLQNWLNGQLNCNAYNQNCETDVIRRLSLQLYRAPASGEEIAALRKIFAAGNDGNYSFQETASHVLQGMLQAPRFIYRIEREMGDGNKRALSAYELASRMSFAIWGSNPDSALLNAAAQGVNQVKGQVNRMLNDAKAISYGSEFFSDWFDLHRLDDAHVDDHFNFDEKLFPDMKAETLATFKHILENDLPLTSVYNLQETWVSEALARHYGFDARGGQHDLTQKPNRGGILTQGAMTLVGGNESSTVRRGLFMLDQILCGKIKAPPGDIDTTPPELLPGTSIRDVSQTRVENDVCGVCHTQFEPLVWGLVPFNAVGEFHTQDEFNNSLPSDGFVVLPGGEGQRDYTNVSQMTEVLSNTQRPKDCAVLKSFEYTMARPVSTADSCDMKAVKDAVSGSNGSYKDLMRALISSEKFSHIITAKN